MKMLITILCSTLLASAALANIGTISMEYVGCWGGERRYLIVSHFESQIDVEVHEILAYVPLYPVPYTPNGVIPIKQGYGNWETYLGSLPQDPPLGWYTVVSEGVYQSASTNIILQMLGPVHYPGPCFCFGWFSDDLSDEEQDALGMDNSVSHKGHGHPPIGQTTMVEAAISYYLEQPDGTRVQVTEEQAMQAADE